MSSNNLNSQIEFSASIQGRKIIYLDTNYWIRLREESNHENLNGRQFLNKITELVESKKCIVPISEITFWEVLKQQDKGTRDKTIKLIDKLSEGISIINASERRILEFSHFFRKHSGKETQDLKQLVWNKISLMEMIATVEENGEIEPFIFKDNVLELNQNVKLFEGENKSFDDMFLSELSGFVDLYHESLNEAMYQMFYSETGRFPSEQEKNAVNTDRLKSLIVGGFKNRKITNELPAFRIVPELFAAVRWNKGRKFKDGNDTMDFLHASFALPYCDYFFTERELHTLIEQRKLDSLYVCKVESNEDKALEILNAITNIKY